METKKIKLLLKKETVAILHKDKVQHIRGGLGFTYQFMNDMLTWANSCLYTCTPSQKKECKAPKKITQDYLVNSKCYCVTPDGSCYNCKNSKPCDPYNW